MGRERASEGNGASAGDKTEKGRMKERTEKGVEEGNEECGDVRVKN